MKEISTLVLGTPRHGRKGKRRGEEKGDTESVKNVSGTRKSSKSINVNDV